MSDLLVFALNETVTVSHTNLTRQKGAVPALPPLAEWLGLDDLDVDRIELFPLSDLGGMSLPDYITLAFAPDAPIDAQDRARLDALAGAVLLMPETATSGAPVPGPQARLIARLPLAEADHSANLPKADTTRKPAPTPVPAERESAPPVALIALLVICAFAALTLLTGWTTP